ncbi:MAG: nuclear transport factor 2 family protein, partial [Bacteroidota bacterium]
MKKHLCYVLFCCCSYFLHAQSDEALIRATLMDYLTGSSYSKLDQIQAAFYEEAQLYLSHRDHDVFIKSPKEYADLFAKRPADQFNGREGRILSVKIDNTIAMARLEVKIPAWESIFIDQCLLKKINGEWKIIAKSATELPKEAVAASTKH